MLSSLAPGLSASYTTQYRPELHIVVLRWQRENLFVEMQDSYEHALALAVEHRCAHWLLDSRRDGLMGLDNTLWLIDEFFPRAVAQLAPAVLHLAVFSSPMRLQQLDSGDTVSRAAQRGLAHSQPYHSQVFTVEGDALAWLTTQPR